MTPFKLSFLALLTFLLMACGGGGSSSDSDSGAPDSILGRTVTMTVDSVEILQDSGYTTFLTSGDTVTMVFADAQTIYTDERLNNQMSVNRWDYSLSGNTGTLNLYQEGGEHHMDYRFSDSTSGTYVWEGESFSSGSKFRYSGPFTVEGGENNSDNTATNAACWEDYYSDECTETAAAFAEDGTVPTFASGQTCASAFPEAPVTENFDCSSGPSGSWTCGACYFEY
ncbi:MAG: hypothetical protein ACQES2_08640 [Pseudomonadota bacterium]